MEVKIVAASKDKQLNILRDMRACLGKSYDKDTPTAEDLESITKNIVGRKHYSLLEGIYTSFKITGVSKAFLGQVTRHRLFSFFVESSRVKEPEGVVLPPAGKYDNHIMNKFLVNYYRCKTDFDYLIARGVSKEDARRVLPLGVETSLVMSGNDRTWFEFMPKRLCIKAESEIREFAGIVLELLKSQLPEVFNYVTCSKCINDCGKGEK